MPIDIPNAIKAFSATGSAIKFLLTWRSQALGEQRKLIDELRHNLLLLDMVAAKKTDLASIVADLQTKQYQAMSYTGFNFNSLNKKPIKHYPSLKNTDLATWQGKSTAALLDNIYQKILYLKTAYPYMTAEHRWSVRVLNIRKRIWLLLLHMKHVKAL